MDSTGNPFPERDQEVDLNETKTDQVHLAILTTLATLETKVGHLGEMFAEHREERSKLGERIGKLEIRQGQIAIVATIMAILSPLIWSELSKRMEAQPTVIHRTIRP